MNKRFVLLGIVLLALSAVPTFTYAQDATQLTLGEAINGQLSEGQAQTYTFEGIEDDLVFISMESASFDAVVTLLDDSGNELIGDDDGGTGDNAFIRYFALPYTGTYTVLAQSYGSDGSGRYSLLVNTASNRAVAVAYGDNVRAEIDTVVPALYVFEGQEDDVVYISMESQVFDCYLALWDEDGNELTYGDDSGIGDNALIVFTVPFDGVFTVIARPYQDDATGRYTFWLETTANRREPIEFGVPLRGELSDLMPYEYTFETPEDDTVLFVYASSQSFVPYIELVDTDGNVLAYDSNSGPGNSAMLRFLNVDYADAYTVRLRGYDQEALGRYEIVVDTVANRAIALDGSSTVEGELVNVIPDIYMIDVNDGDQIRVSMTSSLFMPRLFLLDENLNTLADESYDNDIEFTFDAGGRYYIIARGYDFDALGEYTLSVDLIGR